MNELRYAIALNNAAVSRAYLDHNDCDDTANVVSTFQQAVIAIRSFSEHVTAAFGSHTDVAELQHNSAFGFCFLANGLFPGCSNSRLMGHESEYGLVYNRPLFLPTELRVGRQEDLESVGFIATTTLIFNLALAWHDVGIKSGRDKALVKAGKLYDLVLASLNHSGSGGNVNDHSFAVLRYLVLNNQAQILYALGEYENSQMRVNEMFDELLKADHLSAFLDAEEAKALRLNVMHFKTPYVALAA